MFKAGLVRRVNSPRRKVKEFQFELIVWELLCGQINARILFLPLVCSTLTNCTNSIRLIYDYSWPSDLINPIKSGCPLPFQKRTNSLMDASSITKFKRISYHVRMWTRGKRHFWPIMCLHVCVVLPRLIFGIKYRDGIIVWTESFVLSVNFEHATASSNFQTVNYVTPCS